MLKSTQISRFLTYTSITFYTRRQYRLNLTFIQRYEIMFYMTYVFHSEQMLWTDREGETGIRCTFFSDVVEVELEVVSQTVYFLTSINHRRKKKTDFLFICRRIRI